MKTELSLTDISVIATHACRALAAIQRGKPISGRLGRDTSELSLMMTRLILTVNGLTADQVHSEWCRISRGQGWTYARTRNDKRKRTPCLCGFDGLSAIEKAKDQLFLDTVTALRPLWYGKI